ncbi:hypothetical protein ABPG74_012725 [Tetrahymena malaccensis]
MSITCLTLFEEPQGNNIAYYQLLIIIISIIYFRIKQFDFENILTYIIMNIFDYEFEDNYYNEDKLLFKYYILSRYFSEIIRCSLIIYFGSVYIAALDLDDYTTGDLIKLIHIILSILTSAIFFIANTKDICLVFFKIKRYQIFTDKDIIKVAQNIKKQIFTSKIIIDFRIPDSNKDQSQNFLTNQSYIDLFQKVSLIKLTYKSQIEIQINTNYYFQIYFTKEKDVLYEILTSVEYIDINTFNNYVQKNEILDIVQGRIQNGFIQNQYTNYLISEISNNNERILTKQLLIQNIIITSFYKNLSQSQNFQSQQILYDLYES